MVEVLGIIAFIGALAYGVHRLTSATRARMMGACADAARVLGLEAVALSPDEAAARFLPPERMVHGEVTAFEGEVGGVPLCLAAFTHDSNTMVNGAFIPITATHVVALLGRPLARGPVEISRRVFGSPDSHVSLGAPLDDKAVVLTDDRDGLGRLLRGQDALARQIVDFLQEGSGTAFVYEQRCATLVAHRDPARIRAAARRAVDLVRTIERVQGERAPLR